MSNETFQVTLPVDLLREFNDLSNPTDANRDIEACLRRKEDITRAIVCKAVAQWAYKHGHDEIEVDSDG